jgi:penicillin-binding protein 2
MNPGFAFGDHIKTEKVKRRTYSEPSRLTIRGFLLLLFLFVSVAVCIGRLVYLQLFQGAYYRTLSDSNRIRTQVIYAPRGIIFDRNGVPLVLNSPGFRQVIKDSKGISKTVHLSQEQAFSLLAKGEKNIAVDSLREYPYKDSFAHVLGYIGQISKDDLEKPEFADYAGSDWIGKTGIEEEYEHLLRGKDGKQLVEVDALGREVRPLGQTDPVAGQDITLTLDARLQQAAYAAARDVRKGAVIVSKLNGEILAMVSKPSYDPNFFTLDTTYSAATDSAYRNISSVLSDSENQPLLNRAIGGVYPPGSTFKLVVAAAGLEDKIIDAGYHITDTGVLTVGAFSFANWYYTEYGRKESGDVNVVRALARSNDIFFYKLAELINVDRLSAMAKKFGLGNLLGIDLPGEAKGIVPTQEWKEANIKESWYLGDTYHYGIGQGFLLTTPLQVNSWTTVIANGGALYKPRLLKNQESRVKNQELLSAKTISLIRQGMIESCSTGGVAWPLFDFRIKNSELRIDGKNFMKAASSSADTRQVSIACKTGTAEHGGEKTLPHAWITLFAPAYDPQIVITVLSESSGEGSNVAAPVAKKILEAYFGK